MPPTVLHRVQFTGANGTAWPGWTTGSASGSATIQANAGALTVTNTANAYARGQLTGLAARTDSSVLFSYRWSSTTAGGYLNVYARGSGGWLNGYRPRNGYGLELASNSSTVTVRRVVNGTLTDPAQRGRRPGRLHAEAVAAAPSRGHHRPVQVVGRRPGRAGRLALDRHRRRRDGGGPAPRVAGAGGRQRRRPRRSRWTT